MIDRKKFFDTVRPMFGKLSASQVEGMNFILDRWEASYEGISPNVYLAYALATTKHETANTMQPIVERGARTYFRKYGLGTLAKVLGNKSIADGYTFRGRGYVQLTGRTNYTTTGKALGIDLVGNPELALVPDNAAKIMFYGMTKGIFTGKKFGDYLKVATFDATNARRIINGTDKASMIAGYHNVFAKALL